MVTSATSKKEKYRTQDLVVLTSMELSIPKNTTNLVISHFLENIEKVIKRGGRVTIDGFGTFDISTKKIKRVVNKSMKFNPSAVCVNKLNSPLEESQNGYS